MMNNVMLSLPSVQLKSHAAVKRPQTFMPATQNSTVKFQGNFASTFPTTEKVSARVKAQIDSLSKELGKSPEEVASAASEIGTHVMESKLSAPKTVAMMNNLDQQEALKNKDGSGISDNFYSGDMAPADWKAFKKANTTTLYPSRSLKQRFADLGKKNEQVNFKYHSSEKEGGAALMTFLAIIAPPAWPLLLFTVPTLIMTRKRPYNSLVEGLNALEQATKIKKEDPSKQLVLVTDHKNFAGGGKNYLQMWKMDILSNLDKPKAQ